MSDEKQVLIFGATGNIGGAAARRMLKRGWRVRAVTRKPSSEKARALARLGADVAQADMDDRASVEAAFGSIKRVLSVQNWVTNGVDGEVRQGKLVADVAFSNQVEHLVYGSAGTGDADTGVPHFDGKLEVEAYMRRLGIPFTIIRPAPFMELLSDKQFFPALGAWGVKPRIVGWHTPVPWIAVRDIGLAIANAFEDPQAWVGRDVSLIGDIKTMAECRALFEKVNGKPPFRLPLPLWLFGKLAGSEMITMWQWMREFLTQKSIPTLWQMAYHSSDRCRHRLDMESWLTGTRTEAVSIDLKQPAHRR